MSTRRVRLPYVANPRRTFTEDEWACVLSDWDSGLALLPLSQKWETSRNRLRRLLRASGRAVTARPAAGERHRAWKGGRGVDAKGYVWVLLRQDDPLWCMAGTKGRVLEHRLVMAKHIGRPLLDTETVHHRDGDKANNVIQNLQLRSANHGPGSAFECADCGSPNVRAVDV